MTGHYWWPALRGCSDACLLARSKGLKAAGKNLRAKSRSDRSEQVSSCSSIVQDQCDRHLLMAAGLLMVSRYELLPRPRQKYYVSFRYSSG